MSRLKLTIPAKIRRVLTERILAGQYQPGERLIELQLAAEFQVSQASIREALRELETSRLVESIPRRGTRVRTISRQEMRDAYFVRAILESAAAPGAAAKFKGDVSLLQEEVNGVLEAFDKHDFTEQARHVFQIHRMIVEAGGNEVLLRVWESLAMETRVRIRLDRGSLNPDDVRASYDRILDALNRGEADLVSQCLRRHVEMFAPHDKCE